jgi:hypothetical protein
MLSSQTEPRIPSPGDPGRGDWYIPGHWWLFCLAILSLELVFLALDPLPKVFMGDSASYLHTAITGWIPDDRSYWYGYLIRIVAVPTHTLFPLLLLQCYLGGVTAILVAFCCRFLFACSLPVAFCIGLLCALDPLQLLWQRYVMTEAASLFFYALFLYCAFKYLRFRGRYSLVLVQLLGVVLIGFRMSYLLVVQMTAVLLPLLAYSSDMGRMVRQPRKDWKSFRLTLRRVAVDTLVSVAVMLLLHRGYMQVNGWLTDRRPAYLYATGLHLLAFWAPLLKPEDATDPRLAAIIKDGDAYQLRDPAARNWQRFSATGLVHRLIAAESNPDKANQIAQQTAIRVLRRAPLEVALLAVETYAQFWDLRCLKHAARSDFGHDISPENVQPLRNHFGWTGQANVTAAPLTFLQKYYLHLWPYYLVVVLSPALAFAAIWLSRDWRLPALLFGHGSVMLATSCALAPQAIVRYLQPVSLLTLLTLGILFQIALDRWNKASFPSTLSRPTLPP